MDYDELESSLGQESQRALFDYWRRQAVRHNLPMASDIRLQDFPDFHEQIFLISVKREAARLRFRFEYAGTKIVLQLGQNPKGRWIDEVFTDVTGSPLRLAFVEIAALKRPQLLMRKAGFTGIRGRIEEDLLLPCIGDDDMVELIICHSTTLSHLENTFDFKEPQHAVGGFFQD